MEYLFGTKGNSEILQTKGEAHTDLNGYVQTVREYTDCTITDNFRVVEKYQSAEDAEGNCYDWYVVDNHYRETDKTGPISTICDDLAALTLEQQAQIIMMQMMEG